MLFIIQRYIFKDINHCLKRLSMICMWQNESKDQRWKEKINLKKHIRDFPGGAVVKNPPANAGDMGSSPVREDPTCRGSSKPMCHNYWACTLEPARHNYWALVPQILKPTCLEPMLRNKRSHLNEKPVHCKEEYPPTLATTRESPRTTMKTQLSQK